MASIKDRCNPRVWLRNWLNKSTQAELAQPGKFSVLASQYAVKVVDGEIDGVEAVARAAAIAGEAARRSAEVKPQ
ncbi:MAG: hypothetical protein J0I01_05810 [Stenotrophomonas nitritireducens]|uniref:Uncharacterized protein n=1 Tax=Stenotrophomonas nitritireducens TaxID=83617 RepID=A0A9D8KXM8_9GAMM|nr:hypothetical protein [Stenotrophomonas nitritireducens]MBN8791728.1 hypothetical protein [Stenotrophomonas nitritireducens]MBN8795666.1 hypothetical protein [Stenotrophomonas nitritireducens]MBN8798758.1 hypothetical protein [Stenotrophomonas nitritireducens]